MLCLRWGWRSAMYAGDTGHGWHRAVHRHAGPIHEKWCRLRVSVLNYCPSNVHRPHGAARPDPQGERRIAGGALSSCIFLSYKSAAVVLCQLYWSQNLFVSDSVTFSNRLYEISVKFYIWPDQTGWAMNSEFFGLVLRGLNRACSYIFF